VADRPIPVRAFQCVRIAAPISCALLAHLACADEVPKVEKLEVTGHYASGVGTTDAASAGVITPQLIDDRAILRPGDVLEYIPGMIVTQHSGAGKANQYFLRGFSLDHGTDFATSVAGMPVNQRTHAHGQGYTDLNFMIPELVSRIEYRKGPYSAASGDFAAAGGASIQYAEALTKNLAEVTGGSFGYGRALLAGSAQSGPGSWIYGFEAFHENGPWEVPQNYRKYNGVLRYTMPLGEGRASITAMGYNGEWTSTDQIAQRAVDQGLVDRFGSLDGSDGGKSNRYSLSLDYQAKLAGGVLQTTAYGVRYYLNLFSNFTYFLNNPPDGDQFNQYDNRRTYGWNGNWSRSEQLFGMAIRNTVGWDLRQDRIAPIGIYDSVRRIRSSTTREDDVREASYALYVQNQAQWTDWLRSVVGLRGDLFRFNVASNVAQNSGARSAGIGLPVLSLIFGPWNRTEIYANAGEGYHSNDARGVVATVDPKTLEPLDPATPLVRAKGMEIGVRTEVVPNLQSSLTLWSLKLGSELVFSGDSGTTEPGRPSRRIGVEWSNHYLPAPWLLLDFDLAWTRARFTDADPAGNFIPEALQWTAQAGVTLHEIGPLTAALFGRYFGPRTLIEDGSVRSKATTALNLQATYRFGPKTRLRLDVFNLLNAKADDNTYFYASRLPGEPPQGVADLHFHPMESRTFRAAILHSF
jgi:outer membrane receptor protein involved in Fe transport